MGKKFFTIVLLSFLIFILPHPVTAQSVEQEKVFGFVLRAHDIEKWGVVERGNGLEIPRGSQATVLVLNKNATAAVNDFLTSPGKRVFLFDDIYLHIRGFINESVIIITHDDTMQGIMGLLPEDRQTIKVFSDAFY